MAVVERRKTVRGLVAFSIRMAPEFKTLLEEFAYTEKKSLGMFTQELIEEGLARRKEEQENRAAG